MANIEIQLFTFLSSKLSNHFPNQPVKMFDDLDGPNGQLHIILISRRYEFNAHKNNHGYTICLEILEQPFASHNSQIVLVNGAESKPV